MAIAPPENEPLPLQPHRRPPPVLTTTSFIASHAPPDPARLGAIGIQGMLTGRFIYLDSGGWYYLQPRSELANIHPIQP
jgi:hypothetical protein